MLILAAMFSVAGGVTSSAIVDGNRNLTIIGAAAAGLFLFTQVYATFILKSEDEKELALRQRIRLKQLERQSREAEAIDNRIQEEIRDGNLQRAIDWDEFRRSLR